MSLFIVQKKRQLSPIELLRYYFGFAFLFLFLLKKRQFFLNLNAKALA